MRRLASEGTRPRLPWAQRLPALLARPIATGAILDALHADPSDYVRRSCAHSPACPLGSDPARSNASFQALSRALIGHPMSVNGDARKLSYNVAITSVVDAMYDPSSWPTLTEGLAELKTGTAPPP